MQSRFTAEADSLIVQERHRGAIWAEIAAALKLQLNITISANKVGHRYYWLTMSPEQRQRRRDTINARRREISTSEARDSDRVFHARPPAEVIAERDRRLALRSALPVWQTLLGDPLPGESALDRRAAP